MNKAQYLSTAVASGGNGLYPLSTQGLNFIQDQVALLEVLSKIGGKNYTLLKPYKDDKTGRTYDGYIVVNGELLTLSYAPNFGNGIRIKERRENIVADGTTYREARIYRWAEYEANYIKGVNLNAADYPLIKTNDQLAQMLQDYTAVGGELAKKLTVISTDSLTRVQLDALKDNVRVNCRKGSFALNGAPEYTINVYHHSDDNITQEQILPDSRRFVRYWNPNKKEWGGFFFATENLHIDVKVVRGSTVYIRHGYIPDGVQLVLLRKKKRSRKRRSGGDTGTNENWKNKSALRQPKNQYVHFKGIILSTSSPNNWYVPKCIGVCDPVDNGLIGKELGSLCEDMIVPVGNYTQVAAANRLYKVVGTRVKASHKANRPKTQACCYARIALQFADAGRTYKSAGGEMARMKYRLWFDQRDVIQDGVKVDKITIVRRGFSVD